MDRTRIVLRLGILILVAIVAAAFAACDDDDDEAVAPLRVERSAFLSGRQETPPVASGATGVGAVLVDTVSRRLGGFVMTTGLDNVVAAHIHVGAPGVAGPVIIPLAGGPVTWTVPDNAVLTVAQLAQLNAGELYFNVHTTQNPDGEIRGQIDRRVRTARLAGDQEVPPVATTATGTGILALNLATRRIDGIVMTANLDNAAAAHIHDNVAGSNGPIIVPLAAAGPNAWAVPDNTILTPEQVARFDADALYFNVHTTQNPDGEIRGQILPTTVTLRTATLTGGQEVPPVATAAAGTGVLALVETTRQIGGFIATTGLDNVVAAHIHDNVVGSNGPIIVPLTGPLAGLVQWAVPDNAVLTADQGTKFKNGGLYFNVHTTQNPDGEIRGQINEVPLFSTFTL